MKRGRDKIKSSRRKGRYKDTMSRQILTNGPVNLKSTIQCIEIRAQLQNPINTQLQKKKSSFSGDLKERSGLLKAPVFYFFLFFYFIFFRLDQFVFSI